jgi:signal transduction histidine kinase
LFSSKNFPSDHTDKFLRIRGFQQENEIELQFHSNGISIDREIINEIDRIQSIEDKVNPNLNLKLGIIKKIVADHNGRLNISSSEGTTIFSLFFPK